MLFHAIDSTWRWRIGVGDAFFARYWVQTIRFLARGKLTGGRGVAARRPIAANIAAAKPVQLRARFLDARLAPARRRSDRAGRSARPGAAARDAPPQPGGRGRVRRIAARSRRRPIRSAAGRAAIARHPPATRFSVVAPPGELARPEMDRAALAAAAETTHGKFYTIADADRLLAELPAGRRVPIENLPPIPIWNRWWLLSRFSPASPPNGFCENARE